MTPLPPYSVRLVDRTWLARDIFQLELERPPSFHFEAGQGVRLAFRGVEREYSLVSHSADHRLALCVQLVENGRLSPLLAEAGIGTVFTLTGPHGYFVLQPAEQPPVFVATGTGVAPFVSMVRGGARGFKMIQGAATEDRLLYAHLLRDAAGSFVGCVSRNQGNRSPGPEFVAGRVTDCLQNGSLAGRFDFYLCGRREMVRDATSIIDQRFPGSRVFFEIFF